MGKDAWPLRKAESPKALLLASLVPIALDQLF